ncbi:DNA primase [Flavobacterium rhamnosiphilum]|uniref:DNA primase n=1 Tax=Flavobacterium rhamnosiphilum TaxID=2541724 RepID=A0A4R5FD00_9FLAO|nr:toprim domain-containing protein [Flavobacterium rhamnosiphilum]TDE46877.1 DNA primase [Flavobacterium rhamnosiphilum]
MNSNQARQISIEKVLQKLNHLPLKIIGNDYWYLSPFRTEVTPSFKVNLKLNRWFDHGEQIGGNIIDFLVHKFGFSISEALEYLKPFECDFSFQKQILDYSNPEKRQNNFINKTIPIQHIALVQYLESRQIMNYKEVKQLKEIHYTINDKDYFGIGFQNNSEGWEIRSKYAKICLGKKDITLITNESKTLRIYEGFFDYLSFVQVRENLRKEESDYLILNSVALLLKNVPVLMNYTSIELYLDNDDAGNNYTELIRKQFEQAVDCRKLYREYEDLNDWLKTIVLKERIKC